MSYKVLYRKYRPSTFAEVVGQENVVITLKNSIVQNKISHAYIFSGMRGTGKTSIAKIFAKAINCENNIDGNPCGTCKSCEIFNTTPDIIEIDAASNNGVDEIREIVNNSRLVPNNYKYKVYIIDEVHMLSTGAFNALLKTLEEPLSHVIFILATTDIQKVPITILSRCQRFDFTNINGKDLSSYLKKISDLENIKITDEAIDEIVSISEGAVRDSLSLLDRLSKSLEEIDINILEKGTNIVSNAKITLLLNSINENNREEFIKIIKDIRRNKFDINILLKRIFNILIKERNGAQMFANKRNLILRELNLKYYEIINAYDSYLALELILLDFFSNTEAVEKQVNIKEKVSDIVVSLQENEITTEIDVQETSKTKIETKEDKKTNGSKDYSNLSKIFEVRLNNCFAEASKNELENSKKAWKSMVLHIELNDLALFSIISESELVLSSEKLCVVTVSSESELVLINSKYDKLLVNCNESDFKKDLTFITIDVWKEEKEKYIQNLKNKVKYEIIEEPKLIIKKSKTKAETTAEELFGEENINID